ncbi:ATP-dependent DNA helicase PIF1 [Linum perenne]
MFHGPCGHLFPKSPCMVQGKCNKHFPKKINPETTIDEDGFPSYRRREDGRIVDRNGVQLDNRYVVPYNRYLLLRFDAHINVEFCNKSRAIKYLFKYINKPPDRTMSVVTGDHNPSNEVAPNTGWMNKNMICPQARQYTYVEFPQHYTWISKEKVWRERKKKFVIGRLYYCHPSSGERFYLRMLLHTVRGCTSFEDIKTVDNITYESFKETCSAYGFLADDGEWNHCLQEDGYGGTGKTFLWKVISMKLRSEKKIVLCVASSGIAALLMTGGRTAHSRFHIPIDIHSTSTCHIEQDGDLAELIRNTSLIIWDEASMTHKHFMESLDRTLRDIMKETCYYSSDTIQNDGGQLDMLEAEFPTEFLNSMKIRNFPAHELKLKVGAPVILLRNIDQSTGLCNGTRLIIKRLGTWSVEVLTRSHAGDRVYLRRIALSSNQKSLNFTLIRRQYPIALCFAMTINKSQGQTLHQVGICLKRQVFTHGQLYVAISRVTKKSGLKIISCDEGGHPTSVMKNIVYHEVLN